MVLYCTRAVADSSVLLVVKGGADQDTAPYELRLRSEFAAEGLEVVTASGRSQQNLLDLEGLARRTGAVAALGVFIDTQEVQGRLWVSDPNSNVDLVRTLRVLRVEGDPVALFALRAVEALRGARLELEQQRRRMNATGGAPTELATPAPNPSAGASPKPSAAPTPEIVSAPPRPNPKKPQPEVDAPPVKNDSSSTRRTKSHFTVVAGAVGGFDQNGIGAVGAPFLDVRYAVWERLSLGTSLQGPFLKRMTNNDAGTVRIDQELLELQMRVRLAGGRALSLEGLLSTGPSRIAASAVETTFAGTASSAQGIAWLFGAGVGAQLSLSGHWVVGLDLEWLRRLPPPRIHAGYSRLTGGIDSLILGKLGMGVTF